jgi:hypothetical protein
MTSKFIGIQLTSHSVFDEGADHVLDLLQETAGVNAVLAYSHELYRAGQEPGQAAATMAPDHGVPRKDPRGRRLPPVWFKQHPDRYYAETFLRFRRHPESQEYADRDVFAELLEPCRERGIKLYGRVLEGFSAGMAAHVDNWPQILSIDVYGRPTRLPCFNNPDYRNWWAAMVEDLFKTHPLDGFMYGTERSGPLHNLFLHPHHGVTVPNCFCAHCRDRGTSQGIDVERARRGFRALYEFIEGQAQGDPPPRDGVLVTALRILFKYPEILAWEALWQQSKEDLARLMYGTIKVIVPDAQVGWHIYHNGTSWHVIDRALLDYAEMVPYSDWLKPVVYHEIAGPRICRDVGHLHRRVLGDLSESQTLTLLYAVLGYDPDVEPPLETLGSKGLSPEYVYHETKRCVDAVAGQVPVYAGVGFDIPWGDATFGGDPDKLYQATIKSFEAGAKGLIISRAYSEMRVPNLQAVGRAVRDADAAGL